MDGLSERGFDCLYFLHDIQNGCFIYEGQVIDDLGAFLSRHAVHAVVNQNGYSSRMTESLASTNWQGRYIVCHHSEPRYLKKLYDFRRVVYELFSPHALLKTRIAWLVRFLIYPLWRKWSDRGIAKTQTLNYQHCSRYVVLSNAFLPQFSQLIGQPTVPKACAISNPLTYEIKPEEARCFTKGKEVLIVARLNDHEKRISAALDAWQFIEKQDRDGWTLKIVGTGPDETFLKDKVRQMGLKRVVFHGHQDPLPYYRSASIFLMTSRIEGWGLTLTEAMQTGSVPIAFDAYASLRDIIDHDVTGIIVCNGDILALANAVLRLMEDSALRQNLAGKALGACQRYRLESVLNQWAAIL